MNLCEVIEKAYPFETFANEQGDLFMLGQNGDELLRCTNLDDVSFVLCQADVGMLKDDYLFVGENK